MNIRFFLLLALLIILPGSAAQAVKPGQKPYLKSYSGEIKTHITKYEDTLIKIARDYGIGFNELRAANPGLDPWMPGEGVELVLPTMHILPQVEHKGIVINLPEQRLYYFKDGNEEPITHPLGVGREGLSTPEGKTTVTRKMIGPTWRPTERMRKEDPSLPASIGPGADNPMGTHALYLGWPAYAIHGTNRPYGIGRRVSSGCIRLYPEDIVTLYEQVPVGTQVRVVDQPIKVGWVDDDLYLEAHPSLEQADDMEQDGFVSTYEFSESDLKILMNVAGEYAEQVDWPLVRKVVRVRQGIPVVIASKPVAAEIQDEDPAAPDSES